MRVAALGKSGVVASVLAVGTGTNGWAGTSAQTRKADGWLASVLAGSLDLGVSFWDLADQYGSHAAASAALRRVDRSTLVLATKTTATDRPACERDLARFLQELGTSYLDVVLLHAVSDGAWNARCAGAMDALRAAKEAGIVRAVGVSLHSLAALKTAAKEPWVDVMLARLNWAGTNMDGPPQEVLPVLLDAREAGKGIYAMKVLGCGELANDVRRAVRFVAEAGCVDALTIGPTEDHHLTELARAVEELWPAQEPAAATLPRRGAQYSSRSTGSRTG